MHSTDSRSFSSPHPSGCHPWTTGLVVLLLALCCGVPAPAAGLPAGYDELDGRVRAALVAIEAASRAETEPLSSPLDPAQVGRLAACVNPEAIEALTRVRKQLVTVRKELGLPDVELKVEASGFTRVPDFNSMQGNMLALSRVFPLGGKLSRKAAAAFHEARRAFHEYEGVVADLMRDARVAAAELYSAERQTQILDENIALSKQLTDVARIKYTTGLIVQQDVIKAQVETARYENERLAMVRMAEVARSMLASLLARPSDTAVPTASLPPVQPATASFETLEAIARTCRPEILAASAAIDRARSELGVATAERNRPDLMGQVGRMRDPLDDTSSWQAMVSVNLPWFSSRRKNEIREAEVGVEGEQRRLEAVWNKTRFALREALLRTREAAASLALFRDKLVPQARQALDSARVNYETNQVDFLTLVDAQRALEESSLGQIRAAAELSRRQAELERTLGCALPRAARR